MVRQRDGSRHLRVETSFLIGAVPQTQDVEGFFFVSGSQTFAVASLVVLNLSRTKLFLGQCPDRTIAQSATNHSSC